MVYCLIYISLLGSNQIASNYNIYFSEQRLVIEPIMNPGFTAGLNNFSKLRWQGARVYAVRYPELFSNNLKVQLS